MVDEQTLQEMVRRIVAVAHPTRVILFGSFGRGDYRPDSDLDLMVTMPQVTDLGAEVVRLHEAVGDVGPGVDLLLYTDAEFERRSQVPGTILYWARKEGRALYDAAP